METIDLVQLTKAGHRYDATITAKRPKTRKQGAAKRRRSLRKKGTLPMFSFTSGC